MGMTVSTSQGSGKVYMRCWAPITVINSGGLGKVPAKNTVTNGFRCISETLLDFIKLNNWENGEEMVVSEAHGEVLVKLELKLYFFLYIVTKWIKEGDGGYERWYYL